MKVVKFIIWLLISTSVICTTYLLVTNWNETPIYWKIVICSYAASYIISLVGSIVTTIQDYQINKLIKNLNTKENDYDNFT